MAHTITLSDGTTTADLYALTATFVRGDGWQMAGGGGEPEAGEALDLMIQGASVAAVQTAVATIERLLDGARRRTQTGVGARVFLTVQLDGEASSWRSEVRDGRLDMLDAADRWHTKKLNAVLGLTRLNFWEGAETELQLSAASQSAATGGRTVTNGANSWAGIDSAQVTGSIPAPLKLEMTNTAGSDRAYTEIHIANNVDNDPTNFTHIIQGEDATSGGTTTASASSSGGNMRRVTVNTTATVTFAITSAMTVDAKGAPFLLLARLQALSGAVTVRPELRSTSSVVAWRAHQPLGWNRTTPHLAVLGTMPIPPMQWEGTSNAPITLALVFESESSQTVDIDYLAFLPASNYRLLTMLGGEVANNSTVLDNAIEGWAAVMVSGSAYPIASPRGEPIMVRPNTTQRLYILQHQDDNSVIGDTFSVKASYRPRRLTV